MTGRQDGPVWLDGRVLAELIDACRRDHRAALADGSAEILGRIGAVPREVHAGGVDDVGVLGVALFSAIVRESGLGPGRVLFALVAALVFWDVNGYTVTTRPGKLVSEVRRALRRGGKPAALVMTLWNVRGGSAGSTPDSLRTRS